MPEVKASCLDGDIDRDLLELAKEKGIVGCDTETSGLDCRKDRIATFQLYIPEHDAVIVRVTGQEPSNFVSLIEDPGVQKIFHYAVFDLSFLIYHWGVKPRNIACTKVASKLINQEKKHTLQHLLNAYLGVQISKQQRSSDWFASQFTDEQKKYAVNDVIYLVRLLKILEEQLSDLGLLGLEAESFACLGTQAQLKALGNEGLYSH